MVTKTEIRQVNTQKGMGFCFDVYYNNSQYPNFISCAYKTKIGTKRKLNKYLKTGEFSLYGNAE